MARRYHEDSRASAELDPVFRKLGEDGARDELPRAGAWLREAAPAITARLGPTPDAGHAGYARMDRMPPVPENSAPPADPAVANNYDSFAEAYSAETEANLINAYYARPAILALAGDMAGRRVLCRHC